MNIYGLLVAVQLISGPVLDELMAKREVQPSKLASRAKERTNTQN